jgi:conjugal transfer ATP-binding protein TraC
MRAPDGTEVPFGYTLAVALHVEPQAFTRWKLNTQHKLVDALRHAIPFLEERSISKEVEDGAKQQSIRNLFLELNEMATKVVTLSVTLLLDAPSLEELDARTEVARAAFARAGNSELMVEDVAQVPAFLSTLPGSGPYQLRKKGCTSRNAADFLPAFLPWCGGNKASSLMLTPTGEFFRFALWDKSVGPNAFHGLVAADTGSGKSFTMGALVLDSLASGLDAILVDNGRSWESLTTLMGGIHVPVDLNTSICPFGPYELMLDAASELDTEAVKQVVRFIEVCVTDHRLPSFDLLQQDLVGRAVIRCYREKFRGRPKERPLLGDFRACLQEVAQDPSAAEHDRHTAAELCLRLRMFCDEDGLYSKFLNRPSALRFDGRLLTFELEKVSKDPLTKRIAMAAIMEAVGNRAATRRARTLFVVDEAHEFLGNDPSVEAFLAGCYAKMRKYDVACWTISQKFETFMSSRAAPVIIGNSALKLFLQHSSGHQVIGRYFGLPPRAVAEFGRLSKKNGHYSDVFLIYGQRMATMRVAMHPLAYWILTTDGEDRALLERAAAKNPALGRFELLQELAARFPHGARSAPASPRAA